MLLRGHTSAAGPPIVKHTPQDGRSCAPLEVHLKGFQLGCIAEVHGTGKKRVDVHIKVPADMLDGLQEAVPAAQRAPAPLVGAVAQPAERTCIKLEALPWLAHLVVRHSLALEKWLTI